MWPQERERGRGDGIRSEGHWHRLDYRAGGHYAQLASIKWETPGGLGNTRHRPMRGAASRVFIHPFPVALTEVSPPRTLTRCHFRPPPSTVFPANGGKPQAEKHRGSLSKAASQGVWGTRGEEGFATLVKFIFFFKNRVTFDECLYN